MAMNKEPDERRAEQEQQFDRLARKRSSGLIRETWGFLVYTRKWWLAPLFLMLGVIGGMLLLSGTYAAPFIYALF
jgi:Family of unknown function (DUF5989)